VVLQCSATAGVSAHHFCSVSFDYLTGLAMSPSLGVGVSLDSERFGEAAVGADVALFSEGALVLFLLVPCVHGDSGGILEPLPCDDYGRAATILAAAAAREEPT
jgi:hypothetical protein